MGQYFHKRNTLTGSNTINYSDIKDTALQYSNREDEETAAIITRFMPVVESRINRALDTKDMSWRSVLLMDESQRFYGLPTGFMSMRDIQVQDSVGGDSQLTPVYVAPEAMNAAITNSSDKLIYTIIANQIQVHPLQTDKQLEIVYRKRVTPLSDGDPSNWLSDQAPDVYIFGLLVEISSYAQNAEAASLWDGRFVGAMNELQREDDINRWSGPSLRIQLG